MGCDWFAHGDTDITIVVRDHKTGLTIATFTIPVTKLHEGMPLSVEIDGVAER